VRKEMSMEIERTKEKIESKARSAKEVLEGEMARLEKVLKEREKELEQVRRELCLYAMNLSAGRRHLP
jgi:hypothetical protein